jgi:hypothetical protein
VFAEFERAMIRERVKAGLERARAEGKTLGRPTISTATDAAIRKALKKGDVGIRKIATTLGVGTGHGAADQGGDVGVNAIHQAHHSRWSCSVRTAPAVSQFAAD